MSKYSELAERLDRVRELCPYKLGSPQAYECERGTCYCAEQKYNDTERAAAALRELEEQLQLWREGFQGACYACEPVGERNIALLAENERLMREGLEANRELAKQARADASRVAELEAERDRLRLMLKIAGIDPDAKPHECDGDNYRAALEGE